MPAMEPPLETATFNNKEEDEEEYYNEAFENQKLELLHETSSVTQ
jgi:hypothetical protein